jgi:hypothetical protein
LLFDLLEGMLTRFKSEANTTGFVLCFLKFGERIGVCYDACANMIVEVSIFVNECSDGDIEL